MLKINFKMKYYSYIGFFFPFSAPLRGGGGGGLLFSYFQPREGGYNTSGPYTLFNLT